MTQRLMNASKDCKERNLSEQARTDDASLASFARRTLGILTKHEFSSGVTAND